MPTTASLGEWPAANALIPGSSLSKNTGGTGTPEASAISSTTFSSRRSTGSVVSGNTRRPPLPGAGRTRKAPPAPQVLGQDMPAAGELGHLEQAAAANQQQRRCSRH